VLRFQRPSLPSTDEIDRYLDLSRADHWFSNRGPCWRLLRDRLAERAGAYCVPVSSGTLGLMVALSAVVEARGGNRGGSALMPSFTFVATPQAAIWAGLEPRLCDVASDHWHLDPAVLEQTLREGPASVAIPVSAFGTPPPAETRARWEAACSAAGVPMVVDSAAGFGSIAEDGVPVGAQGDVEVVSFHATKPFAVGEGGAIFTRDRELHERIERVVNFGLRPDRSVSTAWGLNAKMSELHAAAALAVLDRLDQILASRRAAAARIRQRAGSTVSWQAGCDRSTWQFVPAALPDGEARRRAAAAAEGAVETRLYYEPVHELLPVSSVAAAAGQPLTRTAELHERILCLPMANDLDDSELEAISAVLA